MRRDASRCRRWLGALAALGAWLCAPDARAYDAEVDAQVTAQWYSLSSPYGDPTLRRRRYLSTLGLRVTHLLARESPYDPDLTFNARLRLDSDLGVEPAETNAASEGRYVPGLRASPLDVMVAYVEGRNYFGGLVGFRLGRQYVVDPLGWWSFDGAQVSLTTPAYVALESYAGYEQRSGIPLSTQRFAAEGVWRGDRTDVAFDQRPSFLQESRLAPAYGFSLSSTGVQWMHAKVAYRKVINRDTVYVSPFPDAGGGYQQVSGDRVSTERVAAALGVNHGSLGALEGQVGYDLYTQQTNEWLARADVFATDTITLGAAYEYFLPVYDADSIFNWFAHQATTTATGRVGWHPIKSLEFVGTGGVRSFRTFGDPDTYARDASESAASLRDVLGTLDGRWRYGAGTARLRGLIETGERGHRAGSDVGVRHWFDEGLYDASTLVSLYDWSDALRPQRDATSFTYVLGGGISPYRRTRFGVEWEHSMNRLVGQRYRVLATLDLTVLP